MNRVPFDHRQLPPEIWLEILRWATTSEKLITHKYTPFEPSHEDSVTATKRTLVLVCQTWNRLAKGFLYENLQIPHAPHSLEENLGRDGLGNLVRRVVLPYSSTVTSDPRGIAAVSVLRLCTNLETLVRPRMAAPDGLRFHFDAQGISLLSLQRVDWWYNNEAERTGGINSLNVVLRNAPNLRYLSAGGVTSFGHIRTDSAPLSLSELQTIRLQWNSAVFLHQLVEVWSLPALCRIVLDYPLMDSWLTKLWEACKEQLQTVEFGKHVRFLLEDHITPCLQSCPNLTELNYYIFFAAIPCIETRHSSITVIGLHAAVNGLLQNGGKLCEHIQQHFDVLMNRIMFPVLGGVLLYGDWKNILSNPRLASMWRSVQDCDIAIHICRGQVLKRWLGPA